MKKIALAMLSVGVLAFAGCSWKVPENVSVKTNAEYNFSLGTFEKELDNDMDMNSMMGNAGENNEKITTYDYFPGKADKNTQHFMLEVEVFKLTILDATGKAVLTAANPSATSYAIGSGTGQINLTSVLGSSGSGKVGLDFNPSTMFSGMKDALGSDSDVSGKINFSSVPMYLYCETAEGLEADVKLKMFYGYTDASNSNAVTQRGTAEKYVLGTESSFDTIENTPRPAYAKEGETVITNLAATQYIGTSPVEIKNLVNATGIEADDQLYIDYNISAISGTISAEAVEAVDADHPLLLKVYAVIDLPMSFDVIDDFSMDISEMTDKNNNSGSNSSDSNNEDSEFSKYIDVIDSVTIKYVAYRLPLYATSGMQLGIDMVGNNQFEYSDLTVVDKSARISDEDKGCISLPYATIEQMKNISSFNPNIQLLMEEGANFSVPRDKAIEMNIEMSFTTDGIVKVN